MKKTRALVLDGAGDPVARIFLAACYQISAADNTRAAYWSDARRWLEFCERRRLSPLDPGTMAVVAWVEEMRGEHLLAPKTRARRVTSLCSIYRQLMRGDRPMVKSNPFSLDTGPARERARPIEPTGVAAPAAVRALISTCAGGGTLDVRDEAIIRILWATGARRASVLGMTRERLRREGRAFIALMVGKGQKEIRALIQGQAAAALEKWLGMLQASGITTGPVWRDLRGEELYPRELARMLARRARVAGLDASPTPHMFRVAFLTLNPAPLDAKQDAAGHSDPATTRLYDRQWRGRAAFEAMPEIEDA